MKINAFLLSCVTVISLSAIVLADPVMSVSDLGLNGSSNREWLVEIAPDASLFGPNGGSIAFELGFEVTGSNLVGAVLNPVSFPQSNPGNNPFTGGVTFGLQVDTAGDTVFASAGSNLFTTGAAVTAMTIETMGSGSTTLSWGGHTLLPGSAFQYTGSRIAQDATNFDGYQGSLTSSSAVTGDFNGDAAWNCADIDLLVAAIATGSTDLSFDMNGDGSLTPADVLQAGTGWLAVGGANNPAQTSGGNAFLEGDGNLDGAVNGADFIIWNNNKFTQTPAWCSGDYNVDGFVNGADFIVWNNNKFTVSDVAAVPEPVFASFFGLLLAFFICRNSRGC